VINVERSFTVDPAPEVILAYLEDFGHAEQWDPGTKQCVRTDSGPVGIGSTWVNTSKFAGMTTELTYTLMASQSDRLVFVGRNSTATSTDTITVTPTTSGSSITYHAALDMHGLAKLATPAIKLAFEKLGNDTARQLTEVLNSLPEAA
jgi:carbon monoxide dehydrogenase subunit G